MDDEKLIELVRQNMALYDFENSKYCDNQFKEKIWSAIAKELNIARGSICKTRWNQLRDQWRKNKKNKVTKSGQINKPVKKWRYEEEMNFLERFSRQRDAIGNLDDIDLENEEMDRLKNTAATTETQENTTINMTEEDTAVVFNSPTEALPTAGYKREQPKGKKDESASAVVIKYLIENLITEGRTHSATRDPTNIFFESIAAKVKRFTPYYRNIAESRVFNLVQQMEMEQILPTNQHQSSTSSQFQQQQHFQEPTSNNFHDLLSDNQASKCVQQPKTSPAYSNLTAVSYTTSFYDDSHAQDND